jgi:hypothetical protein
MRNKGLFVVLGILGASLFSTPVYAADYWTGNGGRGTSLAVNEPRSIGLPPGQTLTTLVQGYFAATLGTYSAMDVQNRMNTETILKEAELQNESSAQDIGEALRVDYLLVGDITRTSSAFALNIEITRVQNNRAMARHSATYTQEEIEDKTAVNKAALDLLEQMGITLTALARAELQQAASRQTIQGQTALAQGIVAQRNGATVEAMTLYYQAAALDPSLLEAANRVSIVSADIRTGNIGQDRRNDIQWRRDWLARLEETERYFDTFFRTFNQPYALVYTTELQYGDTNYRDETLSVSFTVELLEQSNWTDPVLKTVNNVWQGLNATGRKTEWGFENWPRSRVSNVSPFGNDSKRLTIAVELVNDQGKVIARQTFEERGRWDFSFNRDVGIQSFTSSGEAAKTIRFPAVKADDLTEGLTLQFTTVNGVPVADASKTGLLMITTRSSYRDAAGFDILGYDQEGYNHAGYNTSGFNRAGYNEAGYDRNGYNRAGYNVAGYDRNGFNWAGYNAAGYDRNGYNEAGYDREGYNRGGYNREGYDRSGFNGEGFNKEGYRADGSRYNTAGYDKDGYDKKGYNQYGFNRSGNRRWSPVSSYADALFTRSVWGRVDEGGEGDGFTVGILGAYASFSYNDDALGEFVGGYTLNLLSRKNEKQDDGLKSWGVGVPLGLGINTLENQLILEIGFQLRMDWWELRGTYRAVGFRDNGFTMSAGLCIGPELFW